MPPNRRSGEKSTRTRRPRGRKSSTLTCRNCRTRKIRCDGTLPTCGICQAYHEECLYDKAPPMSQILAMSERIAQLERGAHEGVDSSRNQAQASPVAVNKDYDTAMKATSTGSGFLASQSGPSTAASSSDIHTHVDSALDDRPLTRANAYYETTSSVHAPDTVLQQTPDPATACAPSHVTNESTAKVLPASGPSQVKFWEDRVVEAGSTQLHLPEQTVRHLLHTHWTWVHPAFMFVDKETFLRDAATGGEFYTPLLLSVICLHSTRFTDHYLDEELLAMTKLLLGQAIHQESSISLTQALLQHSAREIGRGNLSQAWLYSGMAFRMAVDLGLFTNTWRDDHGTRPVQSKRNRISQQLAWSCFLWDKVISLYYGRHPTLPEPPKAAIPFEAITDEPEMWQPYDADVMDGEVYSAVPSRKLACFSNFCKLGVIINDVIFNIYGRQKQHDVVDFVRDTRQRLQAWRNNTPQGLRVDVSSSGNRESGCPPQHVLTQNMLYYTTIILLYRPFRSNDSCRATCREAAEGVENLLLRMERTFGLSRCTYAMAYCSYTAATVAVQDTKDKVAGAQQRLDTYLRALGALSKSCPGIQRSIDIISSCLGSDSVASALSSTHSGQPAPNMAEACRRASGASAPAAQVPLASNNISQSPGQQMPAFPFGYGIMPYNTDGFDQTQDMNSHLFSHLDSYPQDWLNFPNNDQADFNLDFFGVDGPL